jgi:MFS family permease
MLSAGQNVATLIVGGCLYGVFWAAIAALQSVVGEVLPRRWRGVAQTMVQFIGTMANPVAQIGGAAALISMPGGVSGWRVVCYFALWRMLSTFNPSPQMNALGTCCMFFFTLALFFLYKPLPVPNPQNRSVLERTLDFDRIGSLLLACSLIPLLMALIWG